MRTNIEIDDELMEQAMNAAGLSTKRAVVEEALRRMVQQKNQARMLDLWGTVEWEGELDEMRRDG